LTEFLVVITLTIYELVLWQCKFVNRIAYQLNAINVQLHYTKQDEFPLQPTKEDKLEYWLPRLPFSVKKIMINISDENLTDNDNPSFDMPVLKVCLKPKTTQVTTVKETVATTTTPSVTVKSGNIYF